MSVFADLEIYRAVLEHMQSGINMVDCWELSADRVNAARRLRQMNGVGENQVTQVPGFADQRLRKIAAPMDPSNRRISVIVQYMVKPAEEDAGGAGVAPAVPGTVVSDATKAAEVPAAKPTSPPH
jgi:chemotaxis protein MotB